MKMTKRMLAIVLMVVTFVSCMCIGVEAATYMKKLNLGYIAPTDSKFTKTVETVKLYGDYDYINFYINSKKNNSYFAYEICSDKEYTKVITGNIVSCDKGTYTFTDKIKLKGEFKSKTYYMVTYALKMNSDGDIQIDKNSKREFKVVVKRSVDFDKKIVMLKETKNTTKGAHIKWSALSGANKYYIYRRSITGSKWTKVGTVSKSKTSFTDSSVKDKNGNYIYTVKAVNKKGTASRYHYAGLTCLFAKAPVLESASVIYNNYIEIEWSKTSSKAKYTIMRKEGNGSWKTLETNYSKTSYTDKTVKSGKAYTYSVKVVLSTDYGKATSSYFANDNKAITFFGAPKLSDVALTETGVKVTWKSVEGVSGYTVMRRPLNKSEGWSILGTVDSATLEFTDATADLESAYIYTVRSEGEKGKGSYYSAGKEFVVLDEPVNVSAARTSKNVELRWNDVPYADQYNIYTMDENGQWQLKKEVKDTFADICFTSFESDKYGEIKYTITSLRDGTNETPVGKTIYTIDFFPKIKYTSYVNDKEITLNWEVNKSDEYNVYRKEASQEDSEFLLIGNTTESVFKDTTVENDVLYVYQVRGVANGVEQYVNNASHTVGISTSLNCEPQISTFGDEIRFKNVSKVYGFNFESGKWELVESKLKKNHAPYLMDGKYRYAFITEADGFKSLLEACVVDYEWYDVTVDLSGKMSTEYKATFTINNPTKEVVEYKIVIGDEEKVIKTDGSKKYSFKFDFFSWRNAVHKITIYAKNENGDVSITKDEFYLMDTPFIDKTEVKSDGVIKITIQQFYNSDSIGWDGYYIYRRVYKSGDDWTKIDTFKTTQSKNGFVKATYTDKTAKKGVSYEYLVKSYKKYKGETYLSYPGKRRAI